VYDVYSNVDRRRPGRGVRGSREDHPPDVGVNLPRCTTSTFAFQYATHAEYVSTGWAWDLFFAVVWCICWIAGQCPSWLDPFSFSWLFPAPLAARRMLFITQTTFSVPSLMCSVMCIVCLRQIILLVVFANDQREEGP